MKKHVRLGSKSEARTPRTFAPAKKTIRRVKARCSQSCFFGSRNIARKTSVGAATKKCRYVSVHRKKLRTFSHALFIRTRPERTAEYRALCMSTKRLRRRSSRRLALEY